MSNNLANKYVASRASSPSTNEREALLGETQENEPMIWSMAQIREEMRNVMRENQHQPLYHGVAYGRPILLPQQAVPQQAMPQNLMPPQYAPNSTNCHTGFTSLGASSSNTNEYVPSAPTSENYGTPILFPEQAMPHVSSQVPQNVMPPQYAPNYHTGASALGESNLTAKDTASGNKECSSDLSAGETHKKKFLNMQAQPIQLNLLEEEVRQILSDILSKRKVLITAGPTLELIDQVRYISNYS